METFQNPALSAEQRTGDLLGRMTIREKIGQIVKLDGFRSYEWKNRTCVLTEEYCEIVKRWPIGSMYGLLRADWWTMRNWENGIPPEQMTEVVNLVQRHFLNHSRLGIPLYLAEEAPHGLMALGSTVFPTGLGMGGTWDSRLIRRIGEVIGEEARAAGIHAVYSPILDIAREPRWSRVEEDFSEDAFLTARFGAEMVRGLQSRGIVSTLKHFVAHGSPEGGHNQASAHLGMIELYNCQLRPFREAIRAGAKSIMSAYHDLDGQPCSGSRRLLTDLLREKLGFRGFVVADRGAIPLLEHTRLAEDPAEAAARAIRAGCDADEGCLEYVTNGLLKALDRGILAEDDLNAAAGHILRVKFETGLFEHPYAEGRPVEIFRSASHEAVALEASRKAVALLKNDGILPLRNLKTLAVIGPNADHDMNQLGDYTAPQRSGDVITLLAGIRKEAAERGIQVLSSRGCGIRSLDRSGFSEALEAAGKADAVIYVPGGCSTKYGSCMIRTETGAASPEILSPEQSEKESGEGTDRASLDLMGVQMELFRHLKATGKPVICVMIQGRPLTLSELRSGAAALLLAWYPGIFGGQAVAEILFGKYNPAGRLPISIPRCSGQLPVYYNPSGKRRDYVDCSAEPEFPFGYGLSYTTFRYSDLAVHGRRVSVVLENTGAYDGEEVVQFYLTDLASSIKRPIRELCGFERIFLSAGEKRRVEFELSDEALGYYNEDLQFVVEPGRFRIAAGGSSVDLIETDFILEK